MNKKQKKRLDDLIKLMNERNETLDLMLYDLDGHKLTLLELEHELLVCKIKSCLLLGQDFTPV